MVTFALIPVVDRQRPTWVGLLFVHNNNNIDESVLEILASSVHCTQYVQRTRKDSSLSFICHHINISSINQFSLSSEHLQHSFALVNFTWKILQDVCVVFVCYR